MICPSCKCEYIDGVTQCADCGVPLVDSLDGAQPDRLDDDKIVCVWSGDDPREYADVKAALGAANIPFADPSSGSSSFPSLGSRMEICVFGVDAERARKSVVEAHGRTDFDELTPDEIESLTLPASDDVPDGDSSEPSSDLGGDWDEDEPVSEVWTGEQEDFADMLGACLRENGIASRNVAEGGRCRLVVHPADEARAREIVREVVEASPPA